MRASPVRDWVVDTHATRSLAVAEAGCLALIAVLARVVYFDHTPYYDEFYHVLAARSWLTEGTLRVGDGAYPRSALFTVIVAWCFGIFGESLTVARLPSVMAGALAAAVLFLWIRREVGRGAAWIGGILLAFDPTAIYLSQLARFYALHNLLFLSGAMAIYTVVTRRLPRSTALGISGGGAVALALALHLQVITLIGLVGIGIWVAVEVGPRWIARLRLTPRWLWAMAVLAVAMATGAVVLWSDLADMWWDKYRASPLWAAGRRDEFRWYLWWFDKYGILWGLFPFAAVLAIAARRTVSLFCVVVFGVVFVLQSLGGTKGDRYISYALPFFFTIWAIILADVLSLLAAKIRSLMIPLRWRLRRPAASGALVAILVGAIALFGAREIRAFKTTVQMLDPRPVARRPYEGRGADWPAAAPVLRRLADSVDVIVSSAGPKSLYYLGRLDAELSASMLADLRRHSPSRDFTMDRRTGRPLISKPESLHRVMECSQSGLVIVERGHLLAEEWIPKPTAAYLAEHAEEVSLPDQWDLKVFGWHHARPVPHDGCPPRHAATRASERQP